MVNFGGGHCFGCLIRQEWLSTVASRGVVVFGRVWGLADDDDEPHPAATDARAADRTSNTPRVILSSFFYFRSI
jgi:hypothetical protein